MSRQTHFLLAVTSPSVIPSLHHIINLCPSSLLPSNMTLLICPFPACFSSSPTSSQFLFFVLKFLQYATYSHCLLSQPAPLLTPLQSGFCPMHSSEITRNYILLPNQKGLCTVHFLLDISAALDTIDHSVLIGLHSYTTFPWLCLQLVLFLIVCSVSPEWSGVPKGSVHYSLLFSVYTVPSRSIALSNALAFSAIYVQLNPSCAILGPFFSPSNPASLPAFA